MLSGPPRGRGPMHFLGVAHLRQTTRSRALPIVASCCQLRLATIFNRRTNYPPRVLDFRQTGVVIGSLRLRMGVACEPANQRGLHVVLRQRARTSQQRRAHPSVGLRKAVCSVRVLIIIRALQHYY